jgi:hypothetical protein
MNETGSTFFNVYNVAHVETASSCVSAKPFRVDAALSAFSTAVRSLHIVSDDVEDTQNGAAHLKEVVLPYSSRFVEKRLSIVSFSSGVAFLTSLILSMSNTRVLPLVVLMTLKPALC